MNHYQQANRPSDIKIDATTVAAIRAEADKLIALLSKEEVTAETLFEVNSQINFISQLNSLYMNHACGIATMPGYGHFNVFNQPMYNQPMNPQYPFPQQPTPSEPPRRGTVMNPQSYKRPGKTLEYADNLSILPLGVGDDNINFVLFGEGVVLCEINASTNTIALPPTEADLDKASEYLNRWFNLVVVDHADVVFEMLDDNKKWAMLWEHLNTPKGTVQDWKVIGPSVPSKTVIQLFV